VLSTTLRQLVIPRDQLARTTGGYRLLMYALPVGGTGKAGARRTIVVTLARRALRAARSSLRRGRTVTLALALSSDRGGGRRSVDRRSVRLRLR
jgi:hypothetical protein